MKAPGLSVFGRSLLSASHTRYLARLQNLADDRPLLLAEVGLDSRRNGEEKVEYPSEELRQVLEKTLGVPLFQEQAMRIAIVGAGFSPSEADRLRRAMATFKKAGVIHEFRDKLIEGSADQVKQAKNWVDELEATGGTAINDALAAALEMRTADEGRSFTIAFFTDGCPTVGEQCWRARGRRRGAIQVGGQQSAEG